ncbi:hypothetical protein HBA55_19100 [Pseudomaricurvus alkylphenolicus]|uniref:hypothetical protein n=1 Tax=Pseudomaricurvus alkylphenolicus TaxID=1306991 RepID=UPI0014238776|nr:hypothetical protein [Pseudomaricurvus alkylphenolicus]NIB41721.1 hypothetical protein [Pseudomaricurvus alkylphenolicus]
MKFESHFRYQKMLELPSGEIRPLLSEIKSIIETRLKQTLSEFDDTASTPNQGAIDNQFVRDRKKRTAYFDAIEAIAEELNELGHRLLPLDQDNDIDFDSTSVSWATNWMSDSPFGLDLEISPSKAQVLWVVSPNP